MAGIPQQWRQTVTWGSQPSGPCPTMARGSPAWIVQRAQHCALAHTIESGCVR